MGLKAEDVFRPGAFPEYTYISRKSAVSDLPYEFRLMQAIKVSGFLTSLVGPSKMGKTILCEKVIGFEKIVEVSGADFSLETDFWKVVAATAQKYCCQVIATTHSYECIVSAANGLKEISLSDLFCYFRVDREKDMTRAIRYSNELLRAAIDTNLEVR